jgi:hypothetical protein
VSISADKLSEWLDEVESFALEVEYHVPEPYKVGTGRLRRVARELREAYLEAVRKETA